MPQIRFANRFRTPVEITVAQQFCRLLPESNSSSIPIAARGKIGYRSYGTMAMNGRSIAIAQIGRFQFCGFTAWMMWLFIHLMQIVQFQNRLLIFLQWGWYYLSFNRSAFRSTPAAVRRS